MYSLLKEVHQKFFPPISIYNIKGIKIKIDNTIPLIELNTGQIAQVMSINKGCKCQTRLASMGLLVGSQIEVIQTGNTMLVAIGSIRLGIGQGVAMYIQVKIIE